MLENAIDVNRCTRPTKRKKLISHINLCQQLSFSTRLKKKYHFNLSSPIFKLLIRKLLRG